MEALRQYIISVVAAAIFCGLLRGIVPKGMAGNLLRLVSGMFLAYTLLSPVAALRLMPVSSETFSVKDAAEEASQMGQAAGEAAVIQIITEQTRTYILEKANALGLSLEVEVSLNEENIPDGVTLWGNASPFERRQLQSTIALDLGIPKENQQWISSS